MKIRNLFVYAAFIWIAACNPKPEETIVESESVEGIEDSNEKFAFSLETLESIKSDPMQMTRAAEISSYFLERSDDFGKLEAKNNFAGIFEASYFIKDPTKKGIRFWYCFNKSGRGGYPKFFLALEQIENFDTLQPESFSDISKKLRVPIISAYTGTPVIGKYDLESYFKIPEKPGSIVNREIEFSEVLQFAFEFKNLMIDLDSIFGHLPSKYAVAYFEYNDAYDSLMLLKPEKIKYTMAYVPIKDDKPNYLRPVLMGIDNSGKTIIDREGYSYGTFLQKSFPPPPNN
ncbi:hypothetical protein [Cognataquiflexum rubidum]|uniref:hypothetical protein n=1 Tax=Cognataquiflexum rubidum TaxID=2922273 RepID=UPI001F1306B6|nr:hypothetical protein [Cognataquiflexum rubidum]MCH6236819.1 hypothetical protein [Cognataquiflexum rubidum]